MNVYPNPASDILKIDFHLPKEDLVMATLISASGIPISEVLNFKYLDVGDYSYSFSVNAIPDGMYFLQLSRKEGLITVKVAVQR